VRRTWLGLLRAWLRWWRHLAVTAGAAGVLAGVTALVSTAPIAVRPVEEATVSRAGVSAAFAAEITTPLCRRLRPDERMYPSAMYYFIVREAALGHDSVTASANLALGQTNGGLQRLRDLPAGE
jgi:hypothetical protein